MLNTEFNPNEYLVCREGKTVPISSLNREELMEELAKSIDFLEEVDVGLEKLKGLCDDFRLDRNAK